MSWQKTVLRRLRKTLQVAILQKQNEQFKIINNSLKATLGDFSIKINTQINELESNRRTEGVEQLEKGLKSKIYLLDLKARQRIDLFLKNPSGQLTKNQ